MPRAIPVLESNVDFIVEYAKALGFNLDHLYDDLKDLPMHRNVAGPQETLYLITDGTKSDHNLTFTTVSGEGFQQNWAFTDTERIANFVEIKRVH